MIHMPGWFTTVVWVVYILACIVMMGFILMQRGRGGTGLAFGMSSQAQSVIGATGADTLLRKVTKLSAGVFFVCALLLAMQGSRTHRSVVKEPEPVKAAAPAQAEAPVKFEVVPAGETAPAPAPVEAPAAAPTDGFAPAPAQQPAPEAAPEAAPAPAPEAPKE